MPIQYTDGRAHWGISPSLSRNPIAEKLTRKELKTLIASAKTPANHDGSWRTTAQKLEILIVFTATGLAEDPPRRQLLAHDSSAVLRVDTNLVLVPVTVTRRAWRGRSRPYRKRFHGH